MIQASRKVGAVQFTATVAPRKTTTQVLLSFNTSEGELLNALLRGYAAKKQITVGAVATEKVYRIIAGHNCLYAEIDEPTILRLVLKVYKYLVTSKAAPADCKCMSKVQSYKRLTGDLKKGFNCTVTGKCKVFCKKLSEGNPALGKLDEAMKAIAPKDFSDVPAGKCTPAVHDFKDVSNVGKLYFAIFASNFAFEFKGNSIVSCPDVYSAMCSYVKARQGALREVVKTFLTQHGAIKTAKDASKAEAVKAKNTLIVKLMSIEVGIICSLFNIPSINVTEKTLTVDPEAVKAAKSVC